MPEGYTFDPAAKPEVDALFRDLGLTQAQAQKVVDFYSAKTMADLRAPYEEYTKMIDGWRNDSLNHPDLRGKLDKSGPVLSSIGRFLSALPDQKLVSDFRQLMDLTGAGNHPAFIRVLHYAAQRLTEGGHVTGQGPSTHGQSAGERAPQPSLAQAMYPHLPSGAR